MSTPTAQDQRLEQTQTPSPAPTVETVPGPRHPRLRHFLRVLRTVVVVLALLAAAVLGGNHVIRQRLAAKAFVDLGGAVLTAEAVSVGSPDAGVVTDVKVAERSQVRAGQELARVMLTTAGTDKPQFQDLRAPTAGTVAALDVPVGGVAKAGEPVIILYDQTKLTFQAQVAVKDLRKLRVGMTASVRGPGLTRPIVAKLDHVVPHVGSDPLAGTDRITVVLVPEPAAVAAVSKLVPGLQFRATVDTRTAVGGTPAVNSAR
jgi:multidrug efflux pump subunit AcrA (membrane-fusion protein)